MKKEPVKIRRAKAKQSFMEKLEEWIENGYYATYTFSTENGVICNTIKVSKQEKLNNE